MGVPVPVKNILAVRNDRFGEFLLTIPAFNALKRGYPEAHLTLAVNPGVRELAACIPAADRVITLENRRYSLVEMARLGFMLRKLRFDLCVIFNPSKYVNFICFFAGIPIRIGYDHKSAFLLTRKIADLKYTGAKHEVDYNLELTGVSEDPRDKTMTLCVKNDIINTLSQSFSLSGAGRLVAVHPWTSDMVKQWPLDRFNILIRKIAGELDAQVVIVGIPGAQPPCLLSGGKIINLAGKTTLVQLAALLGACDLLVSADSGPVHLACCAGTRVLALFRDDMPGKSARRWGPYCAGSAVIAKQSLEAITVDEVFAQVKQMLAQGEKSIA